MFPPLHDMPTCKHLHSSFVQSDMQTYSATGGKMKKKGSKRTVEASSKTP